MITESLHVLNFSLSLKTFITRHFQRKWLTGNLFELQNFDA